MKARKVKGLDPAAPLGDNAERIVRIRLAELCAFMPKASDPAQVEALHDMRIAAKRLRYVLEVTEPCFGPFVPTAIKWTKELQELLGEIHDCDVQLPEVERFALELRRADADAVRESAAGAEDVDPALLATAPHRDDHAGVAALATHIEARRVHLFARFGPFWEDLERRGFRARLEYAVTERSRPAGAGTASMGAP